jgi:SAM-dependent methyltransferase
MSFDVGADAYTRFMGQYSAPLAVQFVGLADARSGQRALDVGCGPGALTAELVERLGQDAVSAVEPSESFLAAIRRRFPDVDARSAGAEHLPFRDDSFDCALAQLVVHFMTDPRAGLQEMARVTRPGGVVAACVWDHAGGKGPLSAFWQAVRTLDPLARDESGLVGARDGQLAQLFEDAGLRDVASSTLTVRVRFASFSDWWEPYTLGVGPAGDHVARLDPQRRDDLKAACALALPPAPFEIEAAAWTAVGQA